MKFTTLFLRTRNVNLLKDVGMIPYLLYKNHGFHSEIVTYRNEEDYSYCSREVKGLQLRFLRKKFPGEFMDGILYLLKNGRGIDVLNVYHLNLNSFFWLLTFKLVKKKNSVCYLKLDMDYSGLERLRKKNAVGWMKKTTIHMADIASVETTAIFQELKKDYGEKIVYIPNGFFAPQKAIIHPYQKEKVFLTVGNIGERVKATDILLEAFAKTSDFHDWKLRLAGPVSEQFQPYMQEYFKRHAALQDRVIFTGAIRDKEQLMREYERASVFVLPSLSESYGIALVEAISRGCYLITTNQVPAGYDLSDQGKFGANAEVKDIMGLSKLLLQMTEAKIDFNQMAEEIETFAYSNFLWVPLIDRLYTRIRQACQDMV